jgi:hypothetical protein
LAAALALALATTVSSASAAGWWPAPLRVVGPIPGVISPVHASISSPPPSALAVGAAGQGLIAWTEEQQLGIPGRTVAVSGPSGGGFSAPQPVGPGNLLDVAVGDQGEAIALLSGTSVTAVFGAVGGSFGAPQVLSPAAAVNGQLSIGSRGDALAVWTRPVLGDSALEAATRDPGGGFGPAQTLATGAGCCGVVRGAIDRAGNAAIVWETRDDPPSVYVAARAAGAPFAAPQRLGPGNAPAVALSDDGEAIVLWYDPAAGMQAAIGAAGGAFTAPQPLSPVGGRDLDVAVDARGNAVAVWDQGDDTVAAVRAPGAPFDAPRPLGIRHVLGVAMNRRGDALVSAREHWAVQRRAGGAFEAPGEMGRYGPLGPSREGCRQQRLELDGLGNALVLDACGGPGSWFFAATAFDVVAPVIDAVTAPSTVVVRRASGFAVAGHDAWSRLTPPVWDFGDGVPRYGIAVAHAFPATGTQAVSVTLRDESGKATTVMRTVAVGNAPDTRPPAIRRLAIVPRRFRVVPRDERRRPAQRGRGTTIRFSLGEAAALRFDVRRLDRGRRQHGRCRAPGPRNRHGRPCTRRRFAGALRRAGEVGSNRVPFDGWIGRRSLSPGRHSLTVTATDRAGNRARRSVAFRVLDG